MIAVAVTRHFVSDAMSKIVSSVIGSTVGLQRSISVRLLEDGLPVVVDEHDRPGELLRRDGLIHEGGDGAEIVLLRPMPLEPEPKQQASALHHAKQTEAE